MTNGLSASFRCGRVAGPAQATAGLPASAEKKTYFVAFAIEDERQRDFLKGQSLSPRAPYEFVDMSVKEAYDSGWKERSAHAIRRSARRDRASEQELADFVRSEVGDPVCKEEGKRIRGIWAYSDDRTQLAGADDFVWSGREHLVFIDSL